ncbi:hypothetical protein [Mycobacterium sp. ACS1612]|uniref:hypothetical protein n=1 Tax=Mycobacterium sp. ACS1612 TaxID=1834117 RepID=UPI0018D4B3BF
MFAAELPRLYEELSFDAARLRGFTGRLFDYAQSHPELMRLLARSALGMPAGAVPARAKARPGKLAAIRPAQQVGSLSDSYPQPSRSQ